MNIREDVLDPRERIGFRLRELYAAAGFRRYRMSKFEEYDLYSRNKEFLFSDGVIAFTDTNGRLMALKPDVTLSIVKNMKDTAGAPRKLYYHENVYRATDVAEGFREQTQVGLECMGAVTTDDVAEVLSLAAASLETLSLDYVLEISHLGLLSAVLDGLTQENALREELLACVGEKNAHGIIGLCREHGVPDGAEETLLRLLRLYGTPSEVLPQAKALAEEAGALEAAGELERAVAVFAGTPVEQHVVIDFSATGDTRYYNGIAFKGFLAGVPGSVLSGGQYDNLMRRMGRKDRAIGFAVFLDMLERLAEGEANYA